MDYFVKAIPFFIAFMAIEALVARLQRRALYTLPDTINNMSLGIFQELVSLFFKGAMGVMYVLVYEHAPRHLAPSVATWVGVLVGVDFCYFLFHWAAHRIGFFWAFHVVHHQSEEYNLAVALRQSAFGGFVSWIFYLPLAWLGFSPEMMFASYSFNLLYQFIIHTRLVGKLGPLEWVLNTPSHHRVHHGRNEKYLDRNYAGALIIWDRLFGTFQEEEEEPTYGIVHPLRSWNPLWANVHQWVAMWNNARTARTWGDRFRCFFMPPGWDPSMSGRPMPPVKPDLTGPKYDARGDRRLDRRIALRFVVIVAITAYFFFNARAFPFPAQVATAALILAAIVAFGAAFERGATQRTNTALFPSSNSPA